MLTRVVLVERIHITIDKTPDTAFSESKSEAEAEAESEGSSTAFC